MNEKIKNLFGFIGRAWRGGRRGKFGVMFAALALYMFVHMFCGNVSLQRFISNTFRMGAEQAELTAAQTKLDTLKHHIQLLQAYSPDYVQELGLKYLNIGDPNFKVLKI